MPSRSGNASKKRHTYEQRLWWARKIPVKGTYGSHAYANMQVYKHRTKTQPPTQNRRIKATARLAQTGESCSALQTRNYSFRNRPQISRRKAIVGRIISRIIRGACYPPKLHPGRRLPKREQNQPVLIEPSTKGQPVYREITHGAPFPNVFPAPTSDSVMNARLFARSLSERLAVTCAQGPWFTTLNFFCRLGSTSCVLSCHRPNTPLHHPMQLPCSLAATASLSPPSSAPFPPPSFDSSSSSSVAAMEADSPPLLVSPPLLGSMPQHAMCDRRTAESCDARPCAAPALSAARAASSSSPSRKSGSSFGPGERKGCDVMSGKHPKLNMKYNKIDP